MARRDSGYGGAQESAPPPHTHTPPPTGKRSVACKPCAHVAIARMLFCRDRGPRWLVVCAGLAHAAVPAHARASAQKGVDRGIRGGCITQARPAAKDLWSMGYVWSCCAPQATDFIRRRRWVRRRRWAGVAGARGQGSSDSDPARRLLGSVGPGERFPLPLGWEAEGVELQLRPLLAGARAAAVEAQLHGRSQEPDAQAEVQSSRRAWSCCRPAVCGMPGAVSTIAALKGSMRWCATGLNGCGPHDCGRGGCCARLERQAGGAGFGGPVHGGPGGGRRVAAGVQVGPAQCTPWDYVCAELLRSRSLSSHSSAPDPLRREPAPRGPWPRGPCRARQWPQGPRPLLRLAQRQQPQPQCRTAPPLPSRPLTAWASGAPRG
jgi:hypothetical protein